MPKHNGKVKEHFRALPYAEVPEFLSALHGANVDISIKLGFEFLVLLRLQELAEGGPLAGSAGTLPGCLLAGNEAQRLLEVRVPPPALTPAVLDDLAMTSKYPKTGAHVDISRWLHGSVEDASLYVEIAWRSELDWITDAEGIARLLRSFPVAPRETARCPLYEAVEVLAAVRDRAAQDARPRRARRSRTRAPLGRPTHTERFGSVPGRSDQAYRSGWFWVRRGCKPACNR